jgi:hypothetical protein
MSKGCRYRFCFNPFLYLLYKLFAIVVSPIFNRAKIFNLQVTTQQLDTPPEKHYHDSYKFYLL